MSNAVMVFALANPVTTQHVMLDFEVEAKKPNPSSSFIMSFVQSLLCPSHCDIIRLHSCRLLCSLPVTTMASKHAEVDKAGPSRSVKEAVAVYAERLVAGNSNTHKTNSAPKLDIIRSSAYSAKSSPPSLSPTSQFVRERDGQLTLANNLKKLEAELHEVKQELKLLEEMQSETKAAVADLCDHLKKSKSKFMTTEEVEVEASNLTVQKQPSEVQSDRWRGGTLAQALSLGRMEDDLDRMEHARLRKKKPIIPLLGDIFPQKKGPSDGRSSIYGSSFYSVLS